MSLISGLRELEILVHNFFIYLVETFGATSCSHRRKVHLLISHFLEIMNQIVYLKWALAFSKTLPFRKILSFNSLFFRVLLHNRFCAYFVALKRMLCAWNKFFQPWIVFLMTCNNNLFSILMKYFSMSLIIFC